MTSPAAHEHRALTELAQPLLDSPPGLGAWAQCEDAQHDLALASASLRPFDSHRYVRECRASFPRQLGAKRGHRVTAAADETLQTANVPSRALIISVLGVTQIFAWGSTYYLLAVLTKPIVADTGWSLSWVVAGVSLGLLIAGVVSPWIGRFIACCGGRPVLAVSAGLFAIGLSALALSQSLSIYLAAWLVIGLGMGAGLYDPAFATLGRLYGLGGRSAITTLTLFGGFASTVCWPLSAFLDALLGWRGACLVYAGFQIAVALPAYLFALPREPQRPAALSAPSTPAEPTQAPSDSPRSVLFLLLAVTITLSSVISATLSVHLLTVLQGKGLSLAGAVGLGALVGPCQVAARTVEMAFAGRHHPVWTHIASVVLVVAGVGALWIGAPLIAFAMTLYGAGIGLESIARGAMPLAIFGQDRYPIIMGRIAMPSLIAQAAAPFIGSILLEATGLNGAMTVIVAAATINTLLATGLLLMLRSLRLNRTP